jgi:hypothetical protein
MIENEKQKEKKFITISIDKLYLLVKEMKELRQMIPDDKETNLLMKKHKTQVEILLLNSILSHKEYWTEHKLNQILHLKRGLLLHKNARIELKEMDENGTSLKEETETIQDV